MTILGIAGFIMVALKDADDARHRARIAAMYDRKRGVA